MSLASFGVRKPVVANLVMIAILAAGLMFGSNLTREFFPEVRPNLVSIAAPYPGASPDEVEEALVKKIEDAVVDLDGVDEITSTAREGLAQVQIEFEDGVDIDSAVFEVKREMDALQDLPDESDRIVVDKFEANLPTINLSLFGDADERVMKDAIKEIREELRSIPGIGDLAITGVRTDELRVEVRPSAMLKHGIGIDRISELVRAEMTELPGGTVKGSASNVTIRTLGAAESVDQVRDIVVKAGGDGGVVRLGEIANVTSGFVDTDIRSRLNGEPAFSITVYKTGDEDAVAMAELVKAYVKGLQGEAFAPTLGERLGGLFRRPGDDSPASDREFAYRLGKQRLASGGVPAGAEVIVTTDLARYIVGRLDLLTRNAFWGGVLVFGTLVVLLNWRISFWVAAGLIVSLAGTLAVMYFVGVTLNLLTMFGLIVVIGLLVDDAIVVAENIASRHERGEPALTAAIKGAEQVAWPVVATVLTTICAFMPLALIQGQIGDFLKMLPVVVACALLVSLIECLFILPSHMGHSLISADKSVEGKSWLGRFERWTSSLRERVIQGWMIPNYEKVLRLALKFRYVSLAIAISVLIGSLGMVAGGRLEFIFFETSDAETLNAELRMPVGTPASVTDAYIRRIEKVVLEQPEVMSAFGSVGSFGSLDGSGSSEQSHLGQVIIEVKPVEQREANGERSSEQLTEAIYNGVGDLAGADVFRIEPVGGGPSGPALNFAVVGSSDEQIFPVVRAMKRMLDAEPGVVAIADDSDRGQRELRISLRPGANELGFTTASVASQLRGYVFGLEPYTFAGDREDVDVRVTLTEATRRSLAELEAMHVFTPAGVPVPLSEVAIIEEAAGYATVRRLDRRRVVTVTADVQRSTGANPETITSKLLPEFRELAAATPGVDILQRGRQKENAESFATLPLGMLVAAVLIYVVLAWLFQSYTQPLVVMSGIPFAITGMIWGHIILGYTMTFLSLIGFVALAGVVVNDSLIYMEFFNERRRAGKGVYDAAVEAGTARFRAILLTTVTTVLGLSPLMLEQSFQARFLIPMAITIAFGLISATFIILLVLPCLLMILRDIRVLARVAWHGRPAQPEDEPRAAGMEPALRSPDYTDA